jgi:hypothetical protein
MIASFFKTSKPIHYIIFSIVLTSLFVYNRIIGRNFVSNVFNSFNELSYFLVLIASLLTLVFIVTKNNLTHNNSFAALFFCLFIMAFPQTLQDPSKLIANLCVLLSLRRIVSLNNKTNIAKKLLDASLWVCLAILFDFFSIFFFMPLIMGLILYSAFEIKNIFIVFCSILAFGVLLSSFNLLVYNHLPVFSDYFTFSNVKIQKNIFQNDIMFSAFMLLTIFFGVINYFFTGAFKNRANRPSTLILIFIIIAGIVAFLFCQIDSKEICLYVLAPTAILMANYCETTRYRWAPELIIISLVIAPILQLSFNLL